MRWHKAMPKWAVVPAPHPVAKRSWLTSPPSCKKHRPRTQSSNQKCSASKHIWRRPSVRSSTPNKCCQNSLLLGANLRITSAWWMNSKNCAVWIKTETSCSQKWTVAKSNLGRVRHRSNCWKMISKMPSKINRRLRKNVKKWGWRCTKLKQRFSPLKSNCLRKREHESRSQLWTKAKSSNWSRNWWQRWGIS